MPLIADPEKFSSIASGVQNYVLAIAIVVGGGWTLYTFGAQLQVENARMTLEKVRRESMPNVAIEILLTGEVKAYKEDEGSVVHGAFNIKNVGNEPVEIAIEDNTLAISPVFPRKDGSITFGQSVPVKLYGRPDSRLISVSALPGRQYKGEFVARLPSAPVYFISFNSERDAARRKEVAARSSDNGDLVAWGAHVYVFSPPPTLGAR